MSQEGIFRVQVLCLLPKYRGEGDADFVAACEARSGVPPLAFPARQHRLRGGMSALSPRAAQAAGEGGGAEEPAGAAGAGAKAG